MKKYIEQYAAQYGKIMSFEEPIAWLTAPPIAPVMVENSTLRNYRDRINEPTTWNRFITYLNNPHEAAELIEAIWTECLKWRSASNALALFQTPKGGETTGVPNILEWYRTEGFRLYTTSPNGAVLVNPDASLMAITASAIKVFTKDAFCYLNATGGYTLFTKDGVQQFDPKMSPLGTPTPAYWVDKPHPATHISAAFADYERTVRSNVLGRYYPRIADYLFEKTLSKLNIPYAHANLIERVRNADGCGYASIHEGHKCQGGYLVTIDGGEPIYNTKGAHQPCQKCNAGIAIGGTIDIPIRVRMDNGGNAPTEAIRFVSPDPKSLEFSEKKLKDLEKQLFGAATGKDRGLGVTNRAINSDIAIEFAGESQTAVLMQIVSDLQPGAAEAAEIINGILFKGQAKVNVSFGDDFAIYTIDDLLAMRALAETQGMLNVLNIDEKIATAASAGNPTEQKRIRIALALLHILGKENSDKALYLYEFTKGASVAAMAASETEIINEIYTTYGTSRNSGQSQGEGQEPQD